MKNKAKISTMIEKIIVFNNFIYIFFLSPEPDLMIDGAGSGSMCVRLLDSACESKVMILYTVCPGSSDPFYVVTYYIKWVTTSWTYSMQYHPSGCPVRYIKTPGL